VADIIASSLRPIRDTAARRLAPVMAKPLRHALGAAP